MSPESKNRVSGAYSVVSALSSTSQVPYSQTYKQLAEEALIRKETFDASFVKKTFAERREGQFLYASLTVAAIAGAVGFAGVNFFASFACAVAVPAMAMTVIHLLSRSKKT
jgi:hypothetical protein